MFENDVIKLYQEVGEIKHDLLKGMDRINLEDQEKYSVATKIDLTVSRLMRLMDKNEIITP
jgi:hypothetical protein